MLLGTMQEEAALAKGRATDFSIAAIMARGAAPCRTPLDSPFLDNSGV